MEHVKELLEEQLKLLEDEIFFSEGDELKTNIDRNTQIVKALEILNHSASHHISVDGYNISGHPDLPDGRKVIWMENSEGEGTTIDVKKLFEWAM